MSIPNDLRKLADRFSEGWHDGIKIDASDASRPDAANSRARARNRRAGHDR